MRILHVVGAMNRGGVETWLMHVLRSIDKKKYKINFLVHTTETAVFDDELEQLGSKIIRCPFTKRPLRYAWELFWLLKRNGPIDVVHSHVHVFSGLIMMVAFFAGVPIRISHGHSDTRVLDARDGILRKLYKVVMKVLIAIFSTDGVAVSSNAALSLFGKKWQCNRKYKILYCGVDLSPFSRLQDEVVVREQFSIPKDAIVLGHVGRMEAPKNHRFLIDVFSDVLKYQANSYLFFVGDGTLRNEVQKYAIEVGVSEKVIFAGMRDDVPNLMKSVMDVFVFPSLWEGLPLTLIEAQASGLRCIVSDTVAREVSISSCSYLPLSEGSELWARTVLSECNKGRVTNGFEQVLNSVFSIDVSSRELLKLYEGKFIDDHLK